MSRSRRTIGLPALGAVDDRAALLEQLAEVVDLVLGDLGRAGGGVDLGAGDLLAEVRALDQGDYVWVLGVHRFQFSQGVIRRATASASSLPLRVSVR